MQALRHGKILLVDDNPRDLELAQVAFDASGRGEDVALASSGIEALHLLQSSPLPDVVLLDLNMPQMDGLAVLSAIRARPELLNLPVVMFSTSRDQLDIRACYDRGASAYVVKPMDFDQFLTTVKTTVEFWTRLNQPPHMTLLSDSMG